MRLFLFLLPVSKSFSLSPTSRYSQRRRAGVADLKRLGKETRMQKVKPKSRQTEVAQTGRIPVGTDVHHHHLRNPSIGYLVRAIRETEALILSGECHPDWGKKRVEALQKMLEGKESKLQKKRASK